MMCRLIQRYLILMVTVGSVMSQLEGIQNNDVQNKPRYVNMSKSGPVNGMAAEETIINELTFGNTPLDLTKNHADTITNSNGEITQSHTSVDLVQDSINTPSFRDQAQSAPNVLAGETQFNNGVFGTGDRFNVPWLPGEMNTQQQRQQQRQQQQQHQQHVDFQGANNEVTSPNNDQHPIQPMDIPSSSQGHGNTRSIINVTPSNETPSRFYSRFFTPASYTNTASNVDDTVDRASSSFNSRSQSRHWQGNVNEAYTNPWTGGFNTERRQFERRPRRRLVCHAPGTPSRGSSSSIRLVPCDTLQRVQSGVDGYQRDSRRIDDMFRPCRWPEDMSRENAMECARLRDEASRPIVRSDANYWTNTRARQVPVRESIPSTQRAIYDISSVNEKQKKNSTDDIRINIRSRHISIKDKKSTSESLKISDKFVKKKYQKINSQKKTLISKVSSRKPTISMRSWKKQSNVSKGSSFIRPRKRLKSKSRKGNRTRSKTLKSKRTQRRPKSRVRSYRKPKSRGKSKLRGLSRKRSKSKIKSRFGNRSKKIIKKGNVPWRKSRTRSKSRKRPRKKSKIKLRTGTTSNGQSRKRNRSIKKSNPPGKNKRKTRSKSGLKIIRRPGIHITQYTPPIDWRLGSS